jgi:2'-5' RNA ligase
VTGLRIFIAIDLPAGIREAVTALQAQLRRAGSDVRWEQPANFHCTLKFLGDVDPGALPEVLTCSATAIGESPRFVAEIASIGCFPDTRRPKVVWVGCRNGDGRLDALKRRLDAALAQLGFAPEERPFSPHLTLGRVKGTRGLHDLLSTMERCTFEPHSMQVSEVVVMRSVLKPEGAEYTIVQSTQLSG